MGSAPALISKISGKPISVGEYDSSQPSVGSGDMRHTQHQESPSEIVLRKAREAIARYWMVERGDQVLVSVSGGADSVALLRALLALREELGISLRVAHLNHGIRGGSADRDEDFVRDLAAQLALP